MVTNLSMSNSLLGSDTTRSRERQDGSQRNRSSSPYRLGISSRYKRDEGYESDPGKAPYFPSSSFVLLFFFIILVSFKNIRIELLSCKCAAGHLLHSKPVSDNTRPFQDQEETSSADCEESSNLVPSAAELVAAPKSGGSDDTSFRSSRLDLEASPFGIEIPSDGPCQLEDAFKIMEPLPVRPPPNL